MSQAGTLQLDASIVPPDVATSYVTNSGTAVPALNVLNVLGTNNITTLGSGDTVTVELSGTTTHSVQIGNSLGSLTSLSVGTNGQLLIGSTGSDPAFATLTSTGGTITITPGANSLNIDTTGSGSLSTLTGNSGGAISPTAGNINTLGTGSITIVGSGSTLTTQLTGITNHSVQVGAGTATLTQLTVGTDGQVLVGASAADPAFATLTSSDSSITFTIGANTLSLQVAGGTTVGKTITGNSGGAISPTSGNWNTLGTGSITIVGSGSTLTTQLTGLTANAVLYGQGSATIGLVASGTTGQVLQTNTSAAPTWSTATYPSTTTINQLLFSSSANTVTGITASNNGVLISGTTGIPSWLGAGTTGLVLTATTGSPPSWVANSAANAILTITGNTGGAESPLSNNFNILGTGSITVAGTANTETVQLTGLTNHNVLVGAGTATITNVAPSATSGVPLISQGASADPVFGTAVVAGGGTGNTTFTAYSVICAGTTATGIFQNVVGLGTAGQVLTSAGASALPTWSDGGSLLNITTVAVAASPYTVVAADQFLACSPSTGTITIKLPNTPTTGRVITIKDTPGDAATHAISVTTVGGTVTIDGQTTYTMTSNYSAINVIFDGANYQIM